MPDSTIIDTDQLTAHRYQCHHVFPDGARCGSPSLRHENRCYYHHETRKPVANPRERNARLNAFEMPFPDSRTTIQAALGDIFARVASNDIDPRRAGLLLYCLQLAGSNLKASERANQKPRQPAAPVHESSAPFDPIIEAVPNTAHPTQQSEPEAAPDEVTQQAEPTTEDPLRGGRISRGTFAALLESLARHQGIDVEHTAYTQHHLESPILATLRAESDRSLPSAALRPNFRSGIRRIFGCPILRIAKGGKEESIPTTGAGTPSSTGNRVPCVLAR
jgi:hypothetical protein